MPFSGPQLRTLSDALLAAFPDYAELRRMVRFGLDANLNAITASPNLRTAVFDLVEWAEAHDRVPDLLRAAREANPDQPALRAVAAQLVPAPAPQPGGPAALVVDAFGRGDFLTIAEALAAAPPGARILVRPGLYEEALLIDKPVEIAGDGPLEDIEVRATGAPAVRFRAKVGRVTNLTLRHAGAGNYAVDIGQGRLELESCDISSAGGSCVAIHGGASPRLRGNRIHDGKLAGVFVYENGGGLLENNDIFANAYAGVEIRTGGNPTFRGNRINKNGYEAVWVYEGGGGTFEDNDLRDNQRGAWTIADECLPRVRRARNQE